MTDMTGAVRFRLPEIMKAKNMRQNELARKMGVHKQTVNRLVSGGVHQIDLETLAKLCDALSIRPEDLLEYSPEVPGVSQ